MAEVTPTNRYALANNGWHVGATVAHRAYRGGVIARIGADGAWAVTSVTARLSGLEPNAILAAMEANNRAWDTPEYRAAKHTVSE